MNLETSKGEPHAPPEKSYEFIRRPGTNSMMMKREI